MLGWPGHELIRVMMGVSDPRREGSEHGCVYTKVGTVVEIMVIACLGGPGHEPMRMVVGVSDPRGEVRAWLCAH